MPFLSLRGLRPWKILLTALVLLLGCALSVADAAYSVTLEWDPNEEPDVIGYRLYYGLATGTYTSQVDVGPATTGTILGMSAGRSYFIAVTAYNSAGLESAPSGEVVFETPPNVAPTIMLVGLPAVELNSGTEIELRADALDTDGSITRVEFFDGDVKLGETTSAPYALDWEDAPPGEHQISAVAYDDSDVAVRSTEMAVKVAPFKVNLEARLPDGSFQVSVTGAIGRTNRIYYSDDLKTWTLLTTAINTEGTLTVVDPGAAGKAQRFYRAEAD